MSITIEHNTYCFWDWDAIFPGETVGDAFRKAGGKVEYDGEEAIVTGLSYKVVMKIADNYNADYMGPVVTNSCATDNLKDVTPRGASHEVAVPEYPHL